MYGANFVDGESKFYIPFSFLFSASEWQLGSVKGSLLPTFL